MYYFKFEEKAKALSGRTISYVARQIGVTIPFLTAVLNGYRSCSKLSAYAITKSLCQDAEIDDYFMIKD